MRRRVVLGVGVLALSLFTAGCACRREVKKEAPVKAVSGKEVAKPTPKPIEEGLATKEDLAKAIKGEEIPVALSEGMTRELMTDEEKAVFKTVYFDFDKSEIRSDARPVLERVADYLKKSPAVKIVVEGHCDEMGTEEYNMALGERRALSVRRYLVTLGVAPERIGTVSYGEERPLDPAHNDAAWAKNRRCEFKIME